MGGLACRVEDFSPQDHERTSRTEIQTTRDRELRTVISLRAGEAREAVFAAVLGVGAAAGRYVIAADECGCTLGLREGRAIWRCDWPAAV